MSKKTRYRHSFRPSDYWDTPVSWVARIKNQLQKQGITEDLALDDILNTPDIVLEDDLRQEILDYLPLLGTHALAGSDLPDYQWDEVEIARVFIQSTFGDVISIRARRWHGWIHYRIVDDSEVGGFTYRWKPKASRKPFTFRELVTFIDNAVQEELLDWYGPEKGKGLTNSLREKASDVSLEGARDFVAVFSDFYFQLSEWYYEEGERWYQQACKEFKEGKRKVTYPPEAV